MRPIRRLQNRRSGLRWGLRRRARAGAALYAGAFIACSALGAAGVVELDAYLKRGDVLPVRSVAVSGASTSQRAGEVLAYADVKKGEPLLALDLDAVATRVEQHPFVKGALVRRVPPDGVEIEVTERAPRALLATGDALYLVDDAGTPLKRARPGDGLDLPVITGVEGEGFARGVPPALRVALDALDVHERQGEPGGALAEIHLETDARAVLVLLDGTRVVLGEGDFETKLARLGRVLEALTRQGKGATRVRLDDDRRPERVAVRLRARPEMGEKPEG